MTSDVLSVARGTKQVANIVCLTYLWYFLQQYFREWNMEGYMSKKNKRKKSKAGKFNNDKKICDLTTDEFYKPTIKKVDDLAGITAEPATSEQECEIITKMFVDSDFPNFGDITTRMIKPFYASQPQDHINKLLVVIKKDNNAKIYEKFPLTMKMTMMVNKKPGLVVFEDEVKDISGVFFRNTLGEIDIEDGDKVLYLFRVNWRFGLFFDFSKKT